MSHSLVVRYTTSPEAAAENVRLVEAVFAALERAAPAGVAYTSYQLADGVSFVHVVDYDSDANPLADLPEFAEFQRDLGSRVVEPPTPAEATIVGSYRPRG